MNIKALITTLVLGSSTMASADTLSVSASAKVSLGFSTSSSAPVVVRDHRVPAPAPAPVVVDPCATTATPVVSAYRPAPLPPVWSGPLYNPTNTIIGKDGSAYRGTLATSPVQMQRVYTNGHVTLRPTFQSSWFDLTEATRIDSGREYFKLGNDNGWFSAIQLQNLGTRGSLITQVKIEFTDGSKGQLVKLNQRLDAAHPSISIDLDGNYRQINRIIVYGSTNEGGAFKILAK